MVTRIMLGFFLPVSATLAIAFIQKVGREGASEGVDRVSARAARATKRTLRASDDFFVTMLSFNSGSGFERTI